MASEERLIPARPDGGGGGERPPWAPRVPWRWILFGATALAVFAGSYWFRERQKTEVLRASILEAYAERVEPVAARYREFRAMLEGWALEAGAAGEPETYADPRLKISGLHDGRGLYLRVRAADLQGADALAAAARGMGPDAITRCLGLTPASARTLYETGSFLEQAFVDEVRDTPSQARLEVLEDELRRRFDRDLPAVLEALRADWFLLAVVRGEDRASDPVDMYLWNLRGQDVPLLRVRTQARGALLPVRIAPGGGDLPPPRTDAGAAVDCSIAAQVKSAVGEPVLGVRSLPGAQDPPPAQEGAPPESASKNVVQE